MGAAARFAIRAKPLLNSPSWPSSVRDPSGKIVTAAPRLSRAITTFIALIADDPRSIGTASRAVITAANGLKR